MNYWEGRMDWTLNPEWKCEICGARSLQWGMRHAQCRCVSCHTQYNMRTVDEASTVVTTPICLLKPEYKEAFSKIWQRDHKNIDEVPQETWDQYLKLESTKGPL